MFKVKDTSTSLPLHIHYFSFCHLRKIIFQLLLLCVWLHLRLKDRSVWSLMWTSFYQSGSAWPGCPPRMLSEMGTGLACQELLCFHTTLVASQQINASEAACGCGVIEKYAGRCEPQINYRPGLLISPLCLHCLPVLPFFLSLRPMFYSSHPAFSPRRSPSSSCYG